jgi:hypothetical protein
MKMQNPYSVIGDAFVDSVVAGNRGKIEGKQEGLSDRLRQYAYYLTENMVEAGDALFVNDLLDAAKRLNPAPTGNAPEPVQKPVNKRDAMTVLHDSLQEWNTEEFCKSDWNTKAAQRAIKDLNRAGFFIGANDELALLKGFVSPRSSWAIYRDGEIVEVCFERGEAQAIFDGLQLDDEDQKYTWSMCQVRNNIGVVVAWRWRPKSRKADWDYTASAAWVEKYKTTIEAEPLYAAPASNPQEAGRWQPINTAPRDGTVIDLMLTGGCRMTDQWWDDEDKSWCGLEESMFTHWAPLPEHPVSSTKEAGTEGFSNPDDEDEL